MSKRINSPPSFATLVQAYFTEYLTQQRALSPQTIAVYRDGFVLFLNFAEVRLGKSPETIALADITPELIIAFLDHLERQRHNSVRSRNARLAALRSFLKFAGHRDVASLRVIERALGVPVKRFERPMFGYLSREEMLAVIRAQVGRTQKCIDLLSREKSDLRAGAALVRDCQHTLNMCRVGWHLERRIPKERANGGQSQVSTSCADATTGLQIVEKSGDQRRIDLLKGQLLRSNAEFLLCEL